MNIGVIRLLPSDVLVSICLLIGPLTGVVGAAETGSGTQFVTELLVLAVGVAGITGAMLSISADSITVQPPLVVCFPYSDSRM